MTLTIEVPDEAARDDHSIGLAAMLVGLCQGWGTGVVEANRCPIQLATYHVGS